MFRRFLAIAGICLVSLTVGVMAEETQQAMPPEMQAMMEAWEKAMTPGPQHAMLMEQAGDWKYTLTYWMPGSEEGSTSTGTAMREALHGGRTLQEILTGEWMGETFKGIALTGYNNVTGEYWSTWIDNMSTGVILLQGSSDEEAKTLTLEGEVPDPMGGTMQMRIVQKTESADHEHHEFYERKGDDAWHKSMEIVYERVK